eukprot:scaffold538_cov66-Skeletonema_marinoi.AAC.1
MCKALLPALASPHSGRRTKQSYGSRMEQLRKTLSLVGRKCEMPSWPLFVDDYQSKKMPPAKGSPILIFENSDME